MEKRNPIFYLILILIFIGLLLLEASFGYKLPRIIFVNLILIYLLVINFFTPLYFSLILALIGGALLDSFSFYNLANHSALLLGILIFEKLLFNIFEKKSFFSWLVIGETLIFGYFLIILVVFIVKNQPLYFLNLFLSLIVNQIIYLVSVYFLYKKLVKVH